MNFRWVFVLVSGTSYSKSIQRKVSQRCFSSVSQKSSRPPPPIRWNDHLGFNSGGQSDPRGGPPSLSPTQKVGGPRAAASSLREIPFKGERSSFAQGDIDRPVDRSWVSSTRHWCSFSSSSARVGGGGEARQATNTTAKMPSAIEETRIIVHATERP